MNRHNFFQSIIAGIGALVGHKYLPKSDIEKAHEKLDKALPQLWPHIKLPKPEIVKGDYDNEFSGVACEFPLSSLSGCSYTITIWGTCFDGVYGIEHYEISTDAKNKEIKNG